MNDSIIKIDHFVITAENLEKSANFYQVLGFDVKRGEDRYELFAGDFKINLHYKGKELQPHAQNIRTGSADFCLEVNIPIEKLVLEITASGYLFETDIVVRHGVRGKMKSVYLRDPDGNLVELSYYF